MHTVLITGANRGLGLEFVKQYLQKKWTVIATCRHPDQAHALQAMATSSNALRILPLDVEDEGDILALKKALGQTPIDVLINNAGVYYSHHAGKINYKDWEKSMRINVMAPMHLVEVLLPNIKSSQKKCIVNISSSMGSIANSTWGSSYTYYSSSKAALNMVSKNLAIELKEDGITVIALHPGWVKTDMGGSEAPLEITDSIAPMIALIDKLSIRKTGKFLSYDHEELPW